MYLIVSMNPTHLVVNKCISLSLSLCVFRAIRQCPIKRHVSHINSTPVSMVDIVIDRWIAYTNGSVAAKKCRFAYNTIQMCSR